MRPWPDLPAFVDRGRTVTWQAFADLVESAAASLTARGLVPGDAVAVAAGNVLELAVLLHACARARLVMVGLDPRLVPPQWEWMCAHMRVRLRLAHELPLPGAEPLAAVLAEAAPRAWAYDGSAREDETYAVVFTSGTTGRPKASQVVHRASVHSAMSYARVLQLQPGERTAVLFALTYISAQHAHVLPAALAGATCVLADSPSPREYVALLREHQVSWAYAVPSWWRLCLRSGLADLPALTRVAAGGAPFGLELQDALRAALPGVRLHDVYGLTETHSPGCIASDEDLRAAPGSVGPPLPCVQARVLGDDGAPVAPGLAGALQLRGSLVTTGYARDPAATAAAVVDGWFDTGDVARQDEAGRVFVLDRTKDMINRGGTKVFSAEVEELLRAHPAVEDAAVVGVPDALAGEAVAAFVVASSPMTSPLTAADVRAWVRDRLAEHAVPRRVELVDALPRTTNGKTDKQALRARLT